MKDGIYILMHDVHNPHGDKRIKSLYNWERIATWEAGTQFGINEDKIQPIGRLTSEQSIFDKRYTELVNNLGPAVGPQHEIDWIFNKRGWRSESFAADVLAMLLKSGKVTTTDVEQALNDVLEEP